MPCHDMMRCHHAITCFCSGIIPPIGGIDLSIMLGFFLISFVSKCLKRMSFGMTPI